MHHNTEIAAVTNDLLMASDEGLISVLVLIDLSSAFDTINHQILLERLEHLIGINGTTLSWFKSYYSHRPQSVLINDEFSMQPHPFCDVLGPILFTLYMLHFSLPHGYKHWHLTLMPHGIGGLT